MPAQSTSSSPDCSHAVFSGAGFLDLGFEKSGFEIAFANELNPGFVEGYRTKSKLLNSIASVESKDHWKN